MNKEAKDVKYDAKAAPMFESVGDREDYIQELEDFIAELEETLPSISGIVDVSRYIKRGGRAHKLWQRLRLNKYPGDY